MRRRGPGRAGGEIAIDDRLPEDRGFWGTLERDRRRGDALALTAPKNQECTSTRGAARAASVGNHRGATTIRGLRLHLHHRWPAVDRGFQPAKEQSGPVDAPGGALGPARHEANHRLGDATPRHPGRGDRAGAQSPIWHVSRDRRRLPATRLHRRAAYRPAALGGFHRAARVRRASRHRRADARAAAVTAVQRSIKPEKASKPMTSAASPKKWILLKDALALITDACWPNEYSARPL